MGHDQYREGCRLFGFDLTPDDAGDGVAYWTPRCYETVKCSLRFRKAIIATATLIVYGQFDNVVHIDGNRMTTWPITIRGARLVEVLCSDPEKRRSFEGIFAADERLRPSSTGSVAIVLRVQYGRDREECVQYGRDRGCGGALGVRVQVYHKWLGLLE